MSEDWLARIEAFDRWHYALPVGPHVTPIFDPAHALRHEERRRHFFTPLVRWLGGLDGRSVLDLGCNAGYWSLLAHRAGARYVRGLDGRAMHVAQAALVREAAGIDPSAWSIDQADVTTADLTRRGPWDVVLCLGLLYHLEDPLGFLQCAGAACADVLVVDTEVMPAPGRWLKGGVETPEDPRSAVGTTRVAVPTPSAVAWAMERAGFEVRMLRPRFATWTGSEDYRDGWRRTFVGAKRSPVAAFPAEMEPVASLPRDLWRLARWIRRRRGPGRAGAR